MKYQRKSEQKQGKEKMETDQNQQQSGKQPFNSNKGYTNASRLPYQNDAPRFPGSEMPRFLGYAPFLNPSGYSYGYLGFSNPYVMPFPNSAPFNGFYQPNNNFSHNPYQNPSANNQQGATGEKGKTAAGLTQLLAPKEQLMLMNEPPTTNSSLN